MAAAEVEKLAGDVVFEAVLADVAQQRLHAGNLDDAGAAEGAERVVGEARPRRRSP